ncbi:hypothetical protein B0H10DRAFT_1045987 [Mycena sp. CBHHK59/15]|nr:hypothetical protein B0H10DRAFT_1045987 [Mycena sp. CBHHK59/15]
MFLTVHNSFGLLFDAVLISAALYGAGLLQFWIYIRKYHSKDGYGLVTLVTTILIFDTCQQALLCHAVYEYLGQSTSISPLSYIN